jgi:hypothetical protein
MKIEKIFSIGTTSAYISVCRDHYICEEFVREFLGLKLKLPNRIKVALNTKNPKKKGFRKVKLKDQFDVVVGGSEICTSYYQYALLRSLGMNDGDWEVKIGNSFHELTTTQKNALSDANVGVGDSFWIKIEKAP